MKIKGVYPKALSGIHVEKYHIKKYYQSIVYIKSIIITTTPNF